MNNHINKFLQSEKKVLKIIWLSLISAFFIQSTIGCAYRLGATAFSSKELTDIPHSERCSQTAVPKDYKTETLEKINVQVLKEPSEEEPEIILSVQRRQREKKMANTPYHCEKEVSHKPTGEYIYDPIEVGFYSTLLNYRQTAARQNKTFADWVFLIGGWPSAGVDQLTFGLWGITGGPILDVLFPAWENEEFQKFEFAEVDVPCRSGPLTALSIIGPFLCLFQAEVTATNSVKDLVVMKETESYSKDVWVLEEVKKDHTSMTASFEAFFPTKKYKDASSTIPFTTNNAGPAVILLRHHEFHKTHPEKVKIFLKGEEKKLLAELTFGWSGKWKSPMGLRLKDDVDSVCAYLNLEDARQRRNCQRIEHNNHWFKTFQRIPALNRQGNFYQVILSGPLLEDMNTPRFGYIHINEPVIVDMRFSGDELHRMLAFLKGMENFMEIHDMKEREILVQTLKDNLKEIAAEKPIHEPNEKLVDFIEWEGNIPVRWDSPLFQYSLSELENVNKVPLCEINRLLKWSHDSKKLLSIVSEGNLRPVINVKDYVDRSCPSADYIPFIDEEIKTIPIEPESYRYDDDLSPWEKIYWIPKEFLP